MSSPASSMPPGIAQAVACITLGRCPAAAALSAQERILLAQIVGCCDKNDLGDPIHVARSTLAQRLGVSRATLQRLLAALCQKGLIELGQVKSRRLGFQVGWIRLSAALLQSLPTIERVSPARHALQTSVEKSSSKSKARSASVSHPTVDPGVVIPQSLRWLVDLGLNPRAIVALMALAKRRGAQLQDVCAAACDGLRRARQPFAYLAKLLRLDRDWAWAAKHKEQQQRRHEDEQRQQSERCRLRQQLLDLQGKTLIDRTRGIKLLIGGSAALVMSLSSSAVSGAVPLSDENLLRIVEQIRCGTLVAA